MVLAGDLFGDGVNIAARLQTLAQPGAVCISGVAYDQVRKVLPLAFADVGMQQVKNIEEPIRAYTASGGPSAQTVSLEKPLTLPDNAGACTLVWNRGFELTRLGLRSRKRNRLPARCKQPWTSGRFTWPVIR